MSNKNKNAGHTRVVRVSVCLPVTVEMVVETMDDPVNEETDWDIKDIMRTECAAYPSLVRENLGDVEYQEMCKQALAAEDV